MKNRLPLETGYYYHIYNRGINSCNLFSEEKDYIHFLNLYHRYIDPIAETLAWVIMPNHFHFLVRLKENLRYKYSNVDKSFDPIQFDNIKWETIPNTDLNLSDPADDDSIQNQASHKIPKPHLHFSHLCNAYTKYYNKVYNRHSALFERPFKRKKIENENYLKQLVLYIHNNPVHHGFCDHPIEYGWSSYLSCLSTKPTKLMRKQVLALFNDEDNFKFMHNTNIEITPIKEWLEIN